MRKKVRKAVILACLVALFAIVEILFWPKPYGEKLVVSKLISVVSGQNVTSVFDPSSAIGYGNSQIEVLATFRLNANRVDKKGDIVIFINKYWIANASISSPGEVILSCCGYSTSISCSIKAGENIVIIASYGFEGEINYGVYVETYSVWWR